ncbi:unnamed protein product [Rhizophagus irregularis]|nr:unnamed protein product [Rhizophagus irregularis]
MSTIKEQTNNSDHVDWIEKVIEKNYITHFNYDEFTNKQEFENNVSSMEKIFRTNWNIIQNNLLINITDSDDIEKIIDKLIDHLIKLHDEFGYGFAGVKQIIEQNIQDINQPLLDDILDWLIKNQTSSKYIFFRGFLYFNGIIVKRNGDKAFALFSKASKDNYFMAQVYLGNYYYFGTGTEKDFGKSVEWYEKSAEQGHSSAQCYLGLLYEVGKGTDQDLEKSYYWYKKAAMNGNKFAQLNLGYFYENGRGTQKDMKKAIEWD